MFTTGDVRKPDVIAVMKEKNGQPLSYMSLQSMVQENSCLLHENTRALQQNLVTGLLLVRANPCKVYTIDGCQVMTILAYLCPICCYHAGTLSDLGKNEPKQVVLQSLSAPEAIEY